MTTVVSFVIVIGILILIHELGHFFVARLTGVGVERFSIGFGPVLFRWRGTEITCLDFVDLGLERTSPGLESPIEDRLRAMSEVAEQKPEPGRDRASGIVIRDHLRRGADTGPAHRGLELPSAREGVPTSTLGAGDRIEVGEHRAGNVPAQIFLPTVAPGEIPAEVDHP